jgi:hypothetical protein
MRYMIFFIYIILPAALSPGPWALGFTQPLTEINTRKKVTFLGNRVRPVRGADNLAAICETIL